MIDQTCKGLTLSPGFGVSAGITASLMTVFNAPTPVCTVGVGSYKSVLVSGTDGGIRLHVLWMDTGIISRRPTTAHSTTVYRRGILRRHGSPSKSRAAMTASVTHPAVTAKLQTDKKISVNVTALLLLSFVDHGEDFRRLLLRQMLFAGKRRDECGQRTVKARLHQRIDLRTFRFLTGNE